MRALFCVVSEKGHLNPAIGPAQWLETEDVKVAFYAPFDIREQLDRAGRFHFLGPHVDAPSDDVRRGAAFADNVRDRAWLRRWIHTLLIGNVADQVIAIQRAIQDWQPDVIIIDPLMYAAAIAAHQQGLPWVSLSNSLNPVVPDTLQSELLDTVTGLATERDELLADYGMQAQFRSCDILSPHLTLAFSTEAFTGPAPSGVTLVGPARVKGPRGDEPPMDWNRLDPDLPLVYMSLGSQIYYQPELFAKVIDVLSTTSVQLLISASELKDAPEFPETGPRTLVMRYAPQLAILRRARLFINHGGANSVMEALTCGVPMILSPLCNDQFHQAYFVECAGVGRHLDLRRAQRATIARTIQQLLANGPERRQAVCVAESYQRDGSAEAARLIIELASESPPERAS